jgi:hypothetical protein
MSEEQGGYFAIGDGVEALNQIVERGRDLVKPKHPWRLPDWVKSPVPEGGRDLDIVVAQAAGWKWNDATAWSPDGGCYARIKDPDGRGPSDPWEFLPMYCHDAGVILPVLKDRPFVIYFNGNSVRVEVSYGIGNNRWVYGLRCFGSGESLELATCTALAQGYCLARKGEEVSKSESKTTTPWDFLDE